MQVLLNSAATILNMHVDIFQIFSEKYQHMNSIAHSYIIINLHGKKVQYKGVYF